ncbi:MAG: adenylate/guanylate cyclase domain-containing protein [Spirochaetales bacterium]|nr:adenylate/guanylate cyclase domain-containing protein [Spirochaetales bacterium]
MAERRGEHLDLADLLGEIELLKEELHDLRVLYENTVEHSTTIENALEDKNRHINNLITSMKMYLSSQLYNSIMKGTLDPKLSYKRKKLTMFFSDIEGFTRVTDMIEPETLSGLLNEYLTVMSDIAVMYGGTIDKFIGDAIVVFFGDPEFVDDETHARQCVRMAVEMLDRIKILSKHWSDAGSPNGLGVRMGINTGFCTVGNFGSETRMDYTIIGGQVNIAARLERVAERNSIYISETTYAFVKNIVRVDEKMRIRVKGVHYPIGVYKVLGMKDSNQVIEGLLDKSDSGFTLQPVSFDAGMDSQAYRDGLILVLEEALRILKKARRKPTEL